MKKILSFIVLSVFLTSLAVPVLVYGSPPPETLSNSCTLKNSGAEILTGCTVGNLCDFTINQNCGMCCLVDTIYTITNWLFYIMTVAVVIVFVIAGAWLMFFTGGDVAKTKKAQGMIILGVVGLVIALVAKLIPSVVKLIVGM